MSLVILACTGLDKPEGSVAREVAIRLAEEAGAEIVCPVVLNRTPARYKKALAENRADRGRRLRHPVRGQAGRGRGEEAGPEGGRVRRGLKKSGRTLEPGAASRPPTLSSLPRRSSRTSRRPRLPKPPSRTRPQAAERAPRGGR